MDYIPFAVTYAMLIMSEVRSVAKWCKARNYHGYRGEPLPDLVSNRALVWINNNPRAFRQIIAEA